MTNNFASGLVIHQHARRLLADTALDQLAVDAHLILRQDALADMGRFAIDRDASGDDQFFHIATRAQAGFGENLVQLRRIIIGSQVAPDHFRRRRTTVAGTVGTGLIRSGSIIEKWLHTPS